MESEPSRTLRVDAETTATTVLTALTRLDPGERMVLQVVMSPMGAMSKPTPRPQRPIVLRDNWILAAIMGTWREDTEAITDMRLKLDSSNYRGIVRIGASANTESRARFLVKKMRGAFSSTNSAPNYWTFGRNTPLYRAGALQRASTPFRGGSGAVECRGACCTVWHAVRHAVCRRTATSQSQATPAVRLYTV